MRLIKKLNYSKGEVIFDKGRFDDYCVFVVEANKKRDAPHDEKYFSDLQIINNFIGNNKIYEDFLKIYHLTWMIVDKKVIALIDEIVETYPIKYRKIIEKWFTVIYGGMVAEEAKTNSRLRKRIKRLGMYQTLVLNKTPIYSARYSYGKDWMTLNKIMKKLGF